MRVQEVLKQFIPAADEVWRLQNGDGVEEKLFQKIAEQGHYAGRTVPTNTRQGIYATAPSGRLLASINTRDADAVLSMLNQALERWNAMPESDRYLEPREVTTKPLDDRYEHLYPKDGLILRVNSRDLPREESEVEPGGRRDNWHETAWNQDYAWFRRGEMLSFIPEDHAIGAERALPRRLASRIARFSLVDNVRGQVNAFDERDIERADVTMRITSSDGDVLQLAIEGEVRAVHAALSREADHERGPEFRERGMDTKLRGSATFDLAGQTFTAFEMAAVGTRWGGTKYNGRDRDLHAAPIGFAFTLANNEPPVAPAFVWGYGWR